MKTKVDLFSILKTVILVFVIFGSLGFINYFVSNKVKEIYKLNEEKQLNLYNIIENNIKEKANNEYNNLVLNNLLDNLKENKYNNINGISYIEYIKNKQKAETQSISGFGFIKGDLNYISKIPVNTKSNKGILELSTNVDKFFEDLKKQYDQKFLILINNNFLNNNIDYDKRVKNYVDFGQNYSIRKTDFKNLQKTMLDKYNENNNLFLEKHIITENDFVTVKSLYDIKNNEIGKVLIAEGNKNKNSSDNVIEIMNSTSQQSILMVMLISVASGLILY
jgi:hypothetical protein